MYRINSVGSHAVFSFVFLIKSDLSTQQHRFSNGGEDKNLSPYAFTKAKNLELLENLKNGSILDVK